MPLFNNFNGPVPTSIHCGSLLPLDTAVDEALLLDNAFNSIDDDSEEAVGSVDADVLSTVGGNDSLNNLTRNSNSHTSSSSPVFISTFSGN